MEHEMKTESWEFPDSITLRLKEDYNIAELSKAIKFKL